MVYDWSEPGETEVVVEDLEELNFDLYGVHDVQQSDWRLPNEFEASILRQKYVVLYFLVFLTDCRLSP